MVTGYLSVATDVPNPVEFEPIRPAGFRILAALDRAAWALGVVLEITCGSNSHPAGDPHTLGEAFDVRDRKFEESMKWAILQRTLQNLSTGNIDMVVSASSGLATMSFYGFIEDKGNANEHFHFQRRHGTVFPPAGSALKV